MNAPHLLIALSLAYAGMLGLCLGMQRHWKQLASPRLPAATRRACMPSGLLLLAASVWFAGRLWPGGMAVVAWLAMLSLTGLGLLLLLPYRPRLALAMPLLGALLAGISAIG